MQPHGDKVPIFLFHPSLGGVLIFMKLARYIIDRPVHALRARGFDNEPLFNDLDEAISAYYSAIKDVQPEDLYPFAG
jgi:thioesterase domain-containing protein